MKIPFPVLLLFLMIGMWSCDPAQDSKIDIGPPPNASFEIVAGSTPNEFTLLNTTPDGFLTLWDLGENGNREGQEVEVVFPFKGEYTVTMTTFNRGGSASTSKPLTVTQDDPNACFGNFRFLTNCFERTWKIAAEEHALHVGPNFNDTWWGNSVNDITARDCHFNDEYIFRANGEFEYDSKGDFWADDDGSGNVYPPALGLTVGCHPASDWPEAFKAWDSGVHGFSVTDATLTISGEGAWLGLYKVGTSGEVLVPQTSITYIINQISNTRMVLVADHGGAIWRFTLTAVN